MPSGLALKAGLKAASTIAGVGDPTKLATTVAAAAGVDPTKIASKVSDAINTGNLSDVADKFKGVLNKDGVSSVLDAVKSNPMVGNLTDALKKGDWKGALNQGIEAAKAAQGNMPPGLVEDLGAGAAAATAVGLGTEVAEQGQQQGQQQQQQQQGLQQGQPQGLQQQTQLNTEEADKLITQLEEMLNRTSTSDIIVTAAQATPIFKSLQGMLNVNADNIANSSDEIYNAKYQDLCNRFKANPGFNSLLKNSRTSIDSIIDVALMEIQINEFNKLLKRIKKPDNCAQTLSQGGKVNNYIKYGGNPEKVKEATAAHTAAVDAHAAATTAHTAAVDAHTAAEADLAAKQTQYDTTKDDALRIAASNPRHSTTTAINDFVVAKDEHNAAKETLKTKGSELEVAKEKLLKTESKSDKEAAVKAYTTALGDHTTANVNFNDKNAILTTKKDALKNELPKHIEGTIGHTTVNKLLTHSDEHDAAILNHEAAETDVAEKQKNKDEAEAQETTTLTAKEEAEAEEEEEAKTKTKAEEEEEEARLTAEAEKAKKAAEEIMGSPATLPDASSAVAAPTGVEPSGAVNSGNLCVIIKDIEGVGGPEPAPTGPTGPAEPAEPVYTDEEKPYKKKEDEEKEEEDAKDEMKKQQLQDYSERSQLATNELTTDDVFGSNSFSVDLKFPSTSADTFANIYIKIFDDGLYFIEYDKNRIVLKYVYFFPFIFTSTQTGDTIFLNRNEATLNFNATHDVGGSLNKFNSLFNLLQHKYHSKYGNNKEAQVKKIDELVKYKLNTYIKENNEKTIEEIQKLFDIQIIKCLNNKTEKLILYYIITITVKKVKFQLFYNFKFGLFYVGTDKPGDDKYNGITHTIIVERCGNDTLVTNEFVGFNVAKYPGVFFGATIISDNTNDSIIPYYSVNILTTPSKNEFTINTVNLQIVRLNRLTADLRHGGLIALKQQNIARKEAEILAAQGVLNRFINGNANKELLKQITTTDNDEEKTTIINGITDPTVKSQVQSFLSHYIAQIQAVKRPKTELTGLNTEKDDLLKEKENIEKSVNPETINNGCNQLLIRETDAKKMFYIDEPNTEIIPAAVVAIGGKRIKQTKRKKQSKRKKQTKRKKQIKRKKGGDITNTGDILDFVFNNIKKNNNYHQYTTVTEEYERKLTENNITDAIKRDVKIMEFFYELQVTNFIISIVKDNIGNVVGYDLTDLWVVDKTTALVPTITDGATCVAALRPIFEKICNYIHISHTDANITVKEEDEFQELQKYLKDTHTQLTQLLTPIQIAYINTKMEKTHKLYSLASDYMNSFYIISSLNKHFSKLDNEHSLTFARKRPLNNASSSLDVSEQIAHKPMELPTDSTTTISRTGRSLIPRTLLGDFAPISDIIYIYDEDGKKNRYQQITGLEPLVKTDYKKSTNKNLNLSIYESIANNYTIKYSEYGRTGNRSWCIFDDNNIIKYIIKFHIVIERKTTMTSKLSLKTVAPHLRSDSQLNLPNSELNEFLNLLFFNPKILRYIDYNKIYDLYSQDTFAPKDDISILQKIKDTPQAVLVHEIVILKLEGTTLETTDFQMSLTPDTKLTALEAHDMQIMLSKVKYLKYGDAYKEIKKRLTAVAGEPGRTAQINDAITQAKTIIEAANNDLKTQGLEEKSQIQLENRGDIVRRLVLRANPYVDTPAPDSDYKLYNQTYYGLIIDSYVRELTTPDSLDQYGGNLIKYLIKILSDIYYNAQAINIPINNTDKIRMNGVLRIANVNIMKKITGFDNERALQAINSAIDRTIPAFLRYNPGDNVKLQDIKRKNTSNIVNIIRTMYAQDDDANYKSVLAIAYTIPIDTRGGNITPTYKLGGGKGNVKVCAQFIDKNTVKNDPTFNPELTPKEGGKNKIKKNKTINFKRINRRNTSNKKTTTNIKNKTKKSKNKTINFKRINRRNKTM